MRIKRAPPQSGQQGKAHAEAGARKVGSVGHEFLIDANNLNCKSNYFYLPIRDDITTPESRQGVVATVDQSTPRLTKLLN